MEGCSWLKKASTSTCYINETVNMKNISKRILSFHVNAIKIKVFFEQLWQKVRKLMT